MRVRSLKRVLMGSAAVAAVSVGMLAAPASQAADRASLMLRGVVPAICSVSVSATNAVVDLQRGQTLGAVASVEERCNAASGYTVSVSSRNNGQLRTDGGNAVGYTMSYGGASGASTLTADRAATGDVRRNTLAVSVPASPQLPAGEYLDVVTISIAAK